MASNANIIRDYLRDDPLLQSVAGQRIWSRRLRHGDSEMDSLAFSEAGIPRPLIIIVERGPRKHFQADVDKQEYRLDAVLQDIELYFYAHASDSGKDAIRQMFYLTKDLLDGHRFTTEIGILATVNYRPTGAGGPKDSEEFEKTVYDWCVYELRTRLSE